MKWTYIFPIVIKFLFKIFSWEQTATPFTILGLLLAKSELALIQEAWPTYIYVFEGEC